MRGLFFNIDIQSYLFLRVSHLLGITAWRGGEGGEGGGLLYERRCMLVVWLRGVKF